MMNPTRKENVLSVAVYSGENGSMRRIEGMEGRSGCMQGVEVIVESYKRRLPNFRIAGELESTHPEAAERIRKYSTGVKMVYEVAGHKGLMRMLHVDEGTAQNIVDLIEDETIGPKITLKTPNPEVAKKFANIELTTGY